MLACGRRLNKSAVSIMDDLGLMLECQMSTKYPASSYHHKMMCCTCTACQVLHYFIAFLCQQAAVTVVHVSHQQKREGALVTCKLCDTEA